MTSAYIFRLYLVCFHGPAPGPSPRGLSPRNLEQERGTTTPPVSSPAQVHHGVEGHESPWIMVIPMVLLALGAVFAGLLGSPAAHHQLFHLLGEADVHEGIDLPLAIWSTIVAGLGWFLAWRVGWQRRNLLPEGLRPLGSWFYRMAANKYFVDECYDRLIIGPFLAATRMLSRFDLRIIDGAVNGTAQGWWLLGQWKHWFDQAVVDRCVNGVAHVVRGIGAWGRRLQTGIIQQYLLIVVVATIILSVILQR